MLDACLFVFPPTNKMIDHAIAPNINGELNTQDAIINALIVTHPSSAVAAHTVAPKHTISKIAPIAANAIYKILTRTLFGITMGFLFLCSVSFHLLAHLQNIRLRQCNK